MKILLPVVVKRINKLLNHGKVATDNDYDFLVTVRERLLYVLRRIDDLLRSYYEPVK